MVTEWLRDGYGMVTGGSRSRHKIVKTVKYLKLSEIL